MTEICHLKVRWGKRKFVFFQRCDYLLCLYILSCQLYDQLPSTLWCKSINVAICLYLKRYWNQSLQSNSLDHLLIHTVWARFETVNGTLTDAGCWDKVSMQSKVKEQQLLIHQLVCMFHQVICHVMLTKEENIHSKDAKIETRLWVEDKNILHKIKEKETDVAYKTMLHFRQIHRTRNCSNMDAK